MFHVRALAHGDSLNYFLRGLEAKHLHGLRMKLLRTLIRNKVLDSFRLLGYFLVAFDGTGSLVFGRRHCCECLSCTRQNGQTIYLHPVLEAKLICYNGMVFSLGTEFLRNQDGATKQDCELKAFYRLVKKIMSLALARHESVRVRTARKKDFPQLRICILGDGL